MVKRNPRKAKNRQNVPRGAAALAGEGANPWIYGLHAVAAALDNKHRRIERFVATTGGFERLKALLPAAPQPELQTREELEALVPPNAVHQGVGLLAAPLTPPSLAEILKSAPEAALIVVLDQVTDPQNVGAVLRSAAAFGAYALVMQDRHAPPISGAMAKAASGAVESLPIVRATNLSRALEELRDGGFWCIGLDGDAAQPLSEARLDGRIALVMGSEDTGLRRLTAEHCDLLARLPTEAGFGVLNVSAAAAAALYECARQRNKKSHLPPRP
jgi:23S rRNA (guanosine2251-2'-O)-methyltransferase